MSEWKEAWSRRVKSFLEAIQQSLSYSSWSRVFFPLNYFRRFPLKSVRALTSFGIQFYRDGNICSVGIALFKGLFGDLRTDHVQWKDFRMNRFKIDQIFMSGFKSSMCYDHNKCRFHYYIGLLYSIVKDSSADLGVNFKIIQNRPTVKAVCTKISKKFFLHICQYFCISERK